MQLMNGIRLYGQPLRLKARSDSGNSGHISTKVEAVPPQQSMGPPQLMPPSLARPPSSVMAMHPANSATLRESVSDRHAGLLRSYSEPEGLGRHESRRGGNVAQFRERLTGSYARPYAQQRTSRGMLAQNAASQMHRLNQAVPRIPQFDARNPYANPHRQQFHHAYGGFRH